MSQLYLADLQAWVTETCRVAIYARGSADPTARALVDGLYGAAGSAAGFERWGSIGPHAAIRSEFALSQEAVSLLLLAAAPKLWGGFAHVFAAITGRVQLDQNVLAALLGARSPVIRELARSAPLVANGLVSIRPTGAIVASADVVCRLAGS